MKHEMARFEIRFIYSPKRSNPILVMSRESDLSVDIEQILVIAKQTIATMVAIIHVFLSMHSVTRLIKKLLTNQSGKI